jgi:hypothetical protein
MSRSLLWMVGFAGLGAVYVGAVAWALWRVDWVMRPVVEAMR